MAVRVIQAVVKIFRIGLLGLWAVLLAGCAGLLGTPLPTPYPTEYIPTVIALTVQAGMATASQTASHLSPTPPPATTTPTPRRTNTPTPEENVAPVLPSPVIPVGQTPTPSATRRLTSTPTPSPTPNLPPAEIQILNIGPMSKIVAPLNLSFSLRSAPASGSLTIELWAEPLRPDEAARLLLRKQMKFSSSPSALIYLNESLDFEIVRPAEFGQLRISTYDSYGRPAAVASVDLLLLQYGETMLNPTGDFLAPIVIREPTANKLIQGGTLVVSGLVRPLGEPFLLVELTAADGRVVGYRQLFVTPAADGSHVAFTIDVPYAVSQATWVRLSIREDGRRIPGPRQLTSLEVLLSP